MEVVMIFTTQGIPPIVVHDFDELKTGIRQNSSETQSFKGIIKEEISEKKSNSDGIEVNIADNEKLEVINGIFDEMRNNNNLYLQFTKDVESQKMVIKIINDETKEVIRQIPPEVALKIARIITEQGQLANARI